MVVYRLTHMYNVGKDKDYEEVRTIGLYSTKKKAGEAMKDYMKIKGFKSHIDGFWIDKWEVDKDLEWGDGFIYSLNQRKKNSGLAGKDGKDINN